MEPAAVRDSVNHDHYDVSGLSTKDLEQTRRDLAANLAFLLPGSPAQVPVSAHLRAVNAELTRRRTADDQE